MTTESPVLPAESQLSSRLAKFLRQVKVRFVLLVVVHSFLFLLIFVAAFFARYDFAPHADALHVMWSVLPIVVLTKIAVFYLASHFHGWWRYVTFADVVPLVRASVTAMFVVAFVDYFFVNFVDQVPRAVIVFDTLLTIFVIGGLRSFWRLADETFGTAFKSHQTKTALLIGTDAQAGQLASQINTNAAMSFRVRGLVATGPYLKRQTIAGIPVSGSLEDLPTVAKNLEATILLVPSGTLNGAQIRELIQLCNKLELSVRVLPRLEDALAGSREIPLREMNIEDLLKRDPVRLDTNRLSQFLGGKRILVTGAGGSIGSEICRQILDFRPAEVLLLGRGENRIYAIEQELSAVATEQEIRLRPIICSITDEAAMRRVFEQFEPAIVFHAAAHKHVPLMELHVAEALKNNVLGTNVIATLADEFRCSHFVMVSSDKAVNPTSVMGATKNLAEQVVYSASQESETRFCVVRFGNVLGSAGSVVPLFQKQIRAGGPITVTDERMTRFFMSIPEASQLVLQAGSMADGGEIYVLDMGEPVRIMQLAEDLVVLSGLPAGSIDIQTTGIRDGEKLYEELYFDDEQTMPTEHTKVRAAYQRPFEEVPIEAVLKEIKESAQASNDELKHFIKRVIPEYQVSFETVATEDEP